MSSKSGGDPGGGKAPRGNEGDSGDSSPETPKNSRGKLLPQSRGAPDGDKCAPQENPRSKGDRGALGGDNRSPQENPSSSRPGTSGDSGTPEGAQRSPKETQGPQRRKRGIESHDNGSSDWHLVSDKKKSRKELSEEARRNKKKRRKAQYKLNKARRLAERDGAGEGCSEESRGPRNTTGGSEVAGSYADTVKRVSQGAGPERAATSAPNRESGPSGQPERGITCPIPTCGSVLFGEGFRRHVLDEHVHPLFAGPARGEWNERTLLSQSLTLTHLTVILGLGRCLKDLAAYVEHYQLLLREPEVTRADELRSLQAFSRFIGEKPLTRYTLSPLNSLAALAHWKVVLAMICTFGPEARNRLGRSAPVPRHSSQSTRRERTPPGERRNPEEGTKVAEATKTVPRTVASSTQGVRPPPGFNVPTGTAKVRGVLRLAPVQTMTTTATMTGTTSTTTSAPITSIPETITSSTASTGIPGESDRLNPMETSAGGADADRASGDEVVVPQGMAEGMVVEPSVAASTLVEEKQSSTEKRLPEGFDSHFHLDRLAANARKGTAKLDALATHLEREEKKEFSLVGAVTSFCDGIGTLPGEPLCDRRVGEEVQSNQRIHMAVGYHPKVVVKAGFSENDRNRLKRALRNAVACGEIGLDYSSTFGTLENRAVQKQALARILSVVPKELPVVFHCREGNCGGIPAREDLFDIVSGHLGDCPQKRIQLHSFRGTPAEANKWLKSFPETYFSFSGLLRGASGQEKEAVKFIPIERLLIETDAPHLPICPPGSKPKAPRSHPYALIRVAKLVAEIRGMRWEEVMQQAASNARRFFNL